MQALVNKCTHFYFYFMTKGYPTQFSKIMNRSRVYQSPESSEQFASVI